MEVLTETTSLEETFEAMNPEHLKVARSLLGWFDVNRGGLCSAIDALPQSQQYSFKLFATELLPSLGEALTVFRYAVCSLMVKYYPEVVAKFPNHGMVHRMEVCCLHTSTSALLTDNADPSKTLLLEWSEIFRKDFVRKNGPFLRLEQLDAEDSLPVSCMVDFIKQSIDAQQHQHQVMSALEHKVSILTEELSIMRTEQVQKFSDLSSQTSAGIATIVTSISNNQQSGMIGGMSNGSSIDSSILGRFF